MRRALVVLLGSMVSVMSSPASARASEASSRSFSVLEYSFLALLVLMTVLVGVFALFVVARMVEPRGVKALLRRLAGKA